MEYKNGRSFKHHLTATKNPSISERVCIISRRDCFAPIAIGTRNDGNNYLRCPPPRLSPPRFPPPLRNPLVSSSVGSGTPSGLGKSALRDSLYLPVFWSIANNLTRT